MTVRPGRVDVVTISFTLGSWISAPSKYSVTVNTEQRLSSDADVLVLISDLCRALFTLHVCHLK